MMLKELTKYMEQSSRDFSSHDATKQIPEFKESIFKNKKEVNKF